MKVALRMRVSSRYGTHLPVLMAALARTTGAVLELGVGAFSTPYLHWACAFARRPLLSVESAGPYAEWAQWYAGGRHEVLAVDSFDAAPLEAREWSVALIDHSPSERRVVDVRRLAERCRFVILHDSNGRFESHYHYSTVYPLFKYKRDYGALYPAVTVVRNFEDLGELGLD
jgi:hypothetical protein